MKKNSVSYKCRHVHWVGSITVAKVLENTLQDYVQEQIQRLKDLIVDLGLYLQKLSVFIRKSYSLKKHLKLS